MPNRSGGNGTDTGRSSTSRRFRMRNSGSVPKSVSASAAAKTRASARTHAGSGADGYFPQTPHVSSGMYYTWRCGAGEGYVASLSCRRVHFANGCCAAFLEGPWGVRYSNGNTVSDTGVRVFRLGESQLGLSRCGQIYGPNDGGGPQRRSGVAPRRSSELQVSPRPVREL